MSIATRLRSLDTVLPTGKHTATLFFFHGSGSCGSDQKQWVDILNREELKFPHIKIVYPSAPAQPYTPIGGMSSHVWFDRKDIAINVGEELESINSMCRTVCELIDKEVADGIPLERIIVGGFSMGGALALHLAYRFKPSVAGCFAISSFLNDNSVVYKHLKASSTQTRPTLLQFHGILDDLVPHEWGQEACHNLKELGVKAQFISVPTANHELTRDIINSLKQWILQRVPLSPAL